MKPYSFFGGEPLVYLITEGQATPANFSETKNEILKIVEAAASAKINLIQIREKNLPARLIFEIALAAREITRKTETKLLINDRADIALAARADGVHLTARSLSPATIQSNFPRDFIIGVSAHSLKEAENARRGGADFVTFSPVFSTPAKGAPQELKNLRFVCERLKPFPVVALGGINAGNYETVLEAGARGFAAIRFLNDARNLEELAAQLK